MLKRYFVRYQLLVVLLLCFTYLASSAVDEKNSYVYIQGDKVTPFYVKIDGKMQPRYGKNYCIIPKLHAGELKLEILFQQNVFPAQTFTITVPEAGGIGYLLDKQGSEYVLYDFESKKLIHSSIK